MAIFEWVCYDCRIYWDKTYSVSKAPNRTKCPECKKLSDRYWQNQGVAISFKDDGNGNVNNSGANDFHTVRRRYEKHNEKGWDKQSADRWLHRQIKNTKDSMDDESFRYRSAYIDYDKLAKDGKVRRLSDKETSEKIERARKLTEQAYDIATKLGYKDIGQDKLDITKPQKQQ